MGGGIEYCVGRINGDGDGGWTSIFGIDILRDELKSLKDWDIGIGRRFLGFFFDGDEEDFLADKIFDVIDDGETIEGDKECFFFVIRERLDSK
jgi:hypothetical protein